MFGGILPFVGFRWIHVDNDGMPTEVRTRWMGSAFMLEWFGCGVILFVADIRPASEIRRT